MGGFFENPDEELVQRWYQAGVWLPFYRAHANMGTDRREPYLYSEEAQTRIRAALRQRYAHIPLWYTLFYEHYVYGVPVVRPLFYQYPEDPAVVDIDNQLLVGDRILVRNIAQPGVSSVNLYLPGGPSEIWYDIETPRLFYGVGNISLDVTLDSVSQYIFDFSCTHIVLNRFQFSIEAVALLPEKIHHAETQQNNAMTLTPFTFLQIRFVLLP